MGGLEAVELRFSQVLEDNSFRFDSEYFKKKYLEEDIYREKFENKYLKDIAFITDGQHGYHEIDENSKISHITAKNTKNWFTDTINTDKLAQWVDDKNKRSSLQVGDILFSTRGTVGQCSLVKKEVLPANIDQDLVRIDILVDFVKPSYLLVYMNSKFGQDWAKRNSSGMVQQGIPISRMKNFPLPITNQEFQILIENLVNSSYIKKEDSKTLYKEAENLLLKELDLLGCKPSKENISIKSFSESFGSSGRLDSEYYLPKYIQYIGILKNYKYSWKSIQEVLINDIKSGTTPKSIIKKYIPNSNYFFRAEAFNNDLTLTYENLYSMSDEVFENYPNITVKQNDILVSMTGTIGSVAIVTKKIDGIINQNIVKLSVNQEIINHNVLALYIKIIGKTLLTREQTGNVQPYVNIPNFSNLIVPLIDKKIQTQIEDKIKESFRLKEESKELLELAKRGVEVAIEEGEEVAMEFIGDIKNG